MNNNALSEYQTDSSPKRIKTGIHRSYKSIDRPKQFKNSNIIDSFMYNFNKFKDYKEKRKKNKSAASINLFRTHYQNRRENLLKTQHQSKRNQIEGCYNSKEMSKFNAKRSTTPSLDQSHNMNSISDLKGKSMKSINHNDRLANSFNIVINPRSDKISKVLEFSPTKQNADEKVKKNINLSKSAVKRKKKSYSK